VDWDSLPLSNEELHRYQEGIQADDGRARIPQREYSTVHKKKLGLKPSFFITQIKGG